MRIAVTGVAGLLGQRLLTVLDADDRVDTIVGIDVLEPGRSSQKLEFCRLDITRADLKSALVGVDVVVHLAAAAAPIIDGAAARRVNVDATRSLLDATSSVNATRFVRASSAAVYGAWANNPIPLSEAAPLRPNPGFLPAAHDAECERLLLEWSEAHPGSSVVSLRAAPIVGSGISSVFEAAAAGRIAVTIKGADRPIQVVHADDVARALALAALDDLSGAYNVAADGWLSSAEAIAVTGRSANRPRLGAGAAGRTLRAMWSAGLTNAPPEVVPYLVHPWVVANDRLRAAGWEPRHTNEEALILAGGVHADRSSLRWTAAVGAVVGGAAAATWWLTRRRK